MFEDWSLIESSFASQYGIRLRREIDMSWAEFCSLLSGLGEDTALGKVVGIRSEKDPETLKRFTHEQKRIRSEWLQRKAAAVNQDNYEAMIANIQAAFKSISTEGAVRSE